MQVSTINLKKRVLRRYQRISTHKSEIHEEKRANSHRQRYKLAIRQRHFEKKNEDKREKQNADIKTP